jgi:hypothetical protein
MSLKLRTHFRSNIIGYVALFFAMTGVAYAATAAKDSVVTRSIKDGAVTSPKFAAGAVAPNARKLGGLSSSAFVLDNQILPISALQQPNLPAGGVSLGHGLSVTLVCHDGVTTLVAFHNSGPSSATLNWLYSDGRVLRASGVVVPAGSEEQFSYAGARLEGQFIWFRDGITTVNLHTFDGGSFCEVRGTAVHATP